MEEGRGADTRKARGKARGLRDRVRDCPTSLAVVNANARARLMFDYLDGGAMRSRSTAEVGMRGSAKQRGFSLTHGERIPIQCASAHGAIKSGRALLTYKLIEISFLLDSAVNSLSSTRKSMYELARQSWRF